MAFRQMAFGDGIIGFGMTFLEFRGLIMMCGVQCFGQSFDVGTKISNALWRCSCTSQSECKHLGTHKHLVAHHDCLRTGTPKHGFQHAGVKARCRDLDEYPLCRSCVVLLTTIAIDSRKIERKYLNAAKAVRPDGEIGNLPCVRRRFQANLRGFRP